MVFISEGLRSGVSGCGGLLHCEGSGGASSRFLDGRKGCSGMACEESGHGRSDTAMPYHVGGIVGYKGSRRPA